MRHAVLRASSNGVCVSVFEPPLRLFTAATKIGANGSARNGVPRATCRTADRPGRHDRRSHASHHAFSTAHELPSRWHADTWRAGRLHGAIRPRSQRRPSLPRRRRARSSSSAGTRSCSPHSFAPSGTRTRSGIRTRSQLSAVVGHIQLKITGTEETGLVVDWQAHFANPECDASTAFGGGCVMVQDSEETPESRMSRSCACSRRAIRWAAATTSSRARARSRRRSPPS